MSTFTRDQDAERVRKAEESIKNSPYNLESWSVLIRHAQKMTDVKKARRIYESLLKHFPTSGRYWRLYIEQELGVNHPNWDHVERLFKRCLNNVLNVDLWKVYLNYIRQHKCKQIRGEGHNNGDPVHRERNQMVDSYEFALSKVGLDIHSFSIWNDYISYLQQAPPPQSAIEVGMAPGGQGSEYAEGQKIVKIRKVYQRSVVTPFLNLESVWRDYSQWEQNINPTIAKKMVDDRQRDFQVAKKVARELDQLTRGLNRNAPALPPSGGSSTDEKRQVDMWRKIIEWEKCNNCKSPDPAMVIKRVIFTYEQCLQCMAHHATIWYEAADYMIRAADLYRERNAEDAKLLDEQTQKLFERAIADDSPVRASKLLHFKYAEFQEKMRRYDHVHLIYKRLYQKSIGGGAVISEQDMLLMGISDDVSRLDDPLANIPPMVIRDPALGYIQHMRFARRVEGIKSARAIFKKARTDERLTYHVYVFSALMEYNCTKDTTVSQKIFELGLKRFKNDVEFLQQYTKFMQTLNESNNTRVLYERVLAESYKTMGGNSVEEAADHESEFLWNDYLQFESMIGDLKSIQSVEERKLTSTIAPDAMNINNPFVLTDQVRQTLNSMGNDRERFHKKKMENFDTRYDSSFVRSDIIQRNRANIFIDRYSFLGLDSCPDNELRSQGLDQKSLNDINQDLVTPEEALAAKSGNLSSGAALAETVENKKQNKLGKSKNSKENEKSSTWRLNRRPACDQLGPESKRKMTEIEPFVRPSFRQMTPFKPEHHPWPSRIGTKGGNFPPPPSAAALMRMMPPPRCFLGPFVIIDQLLDKMRSAKLPDKKEYISAVKSGAYEKQDMIKKEDPKKGVMNGDAEVGGEDATVPGSKRGLDDTSKQPGESDDLYKIRQVKRSK